MRTVYLLLIGAFLGVSNAKHHHAARAPIINLQGAEELVAVVREDENIISTVPDFAILSETGPVCNYILTSQNNEPVPFDIQVVDKFTGAAVLRVKDSAILDCKKPEYNLQVQAVKCDNDKVKSEGVSLKIRVKDTNNHAPEIENPWYTFHVEEGKVVEEVGVLKASDKDCGHPNGEICEYEITNELKELPFAINNQGVLRTTQPLNFTQSKSYILTVVAIDCAMRKSKSSLVTVHVDEKCVQGITAMNERVNYAAGTGSKLLLPDVSLEFCEKETVCEPKNVQSIIELRAGHVTQGCARDTVYDNQTIQSCGLSTATVKLLNEEALTSSAENQILADQGIEFDGARGLTVADDAHQGLIPDHFTLSFSMKHAAGTKDEQSNKQNILCESDDYKTTSTSENVIVEWRGSNHQSFHFIYISNILEMDLPRPKALLSHHGYDVGQGAIAGGAVAVVVVVCVGFLLVLLVIGVLKMRDTPMPRRRRQKRQSDGGMHWDDSGMNITVNPLDDVEKNGGVIDEFSDEEEEEETDGESECSYRDEEEDVSEDEEDQTEVLPHMDANQRVVGGLEWDDEDAISTNARSYRV
ncbi:CBN-CASY-1 protein [Caenorhabditis brenneri]|uniref:CBN-CASY-1 protein n=1 Tax=Caenorhabditis brenneri TaxID=135651 RepID=G0MZD6_CAEBE|nr:CBN-CASY-1 protein [Caenorhabditis brenneri]